MDDDRTPPNDRDAERVVLGAMMLSRDVIAEVVGIITPADHYAPAHEEIHDAIVTLFSAGEPVDPVAVSGELTRRKMLGKVGGAEYLHTLISGVLTIPATAVYHAERVRDLALKRRLIMAGQQIVQVAYDPARDAPESLDAAQAALYDAAPSQRSEDYRRVGDLLDESVDAIEAAGHNTDAITGTPTGFYDLDDLLGGLHPGQSVVVAGRPASGKSTLVVDIARAASIHAGRPSVIFSLEMGRHEIVTRILSAEAKVALTALRSGHLSEFDWGRVAAALPRISRAPLYVDDSPNLTMTEIRAKARRLHHEQPLAMVAVDYLQLMTSGRRVESRQLEVSEFSRQLKLLAKELDVPVVVLSQLNRGPEQRANKRPMLSDLRESGAIEQDADVVILVHREDLYEQESSRPGEADLIVAKHRNGPTRDVVVAAQLHYSRFVDLAH